MNSTINYKNGLLRIWVIAAALWATVCVFAMHSEALYAFRYVADFSAVKAEADERHALQVTKLRRDVTQLEARAEQVKVENAEFAKTHYGRAFTQAGIEPSYQEGSDLRESRLLLSAMEQLDGTPAQPEWYLLRWAVIPPMAVLILGFVVFSLWTWVAKGFKSTSST